MQLLQAIPQPVIAAVHGTATAAGCQLVATADIAIAAPSAKFATPGVNIGLFCSTPAVALARCVGQKAAMDMLLTGRMVLASEALQMGLISRICSSTGSNDLDSERVAVQATGLELAREIAKHSGSALSIGKRTFYEQVNKELDAAYAIAAEAMVSNIMKRDAQEGMSCFLNRCAPTWRHD